MKINDRIFDLEQKISELENLKDIYLNKAKYCNDEIYKLQKKINDLKNCGLKICCYECDRLRCDQRCKVDKQRCESVVDKEPKGLLDN